MKKRKTLLIFVLICSLFLVCGCDKKKNENKKVKLYDTLSEKCKDKDYFLTDESFLYKDDNTIKDVYSITNGKYNIYLYVLKDLEQADYTFSYYEARYKTIKTDSDKYKVINNSDYNVIEFISSDKYAYVYSSDDIFIVSEEKIDFKDEIINTLKDFDYYKRK